MYTSKARLQLADDLRGQRADGGILDVAQQVLHANFLRLGLPDADWQVLEYALRLLRGLLLDLLLRDVRVDRQANLLGLRSPRDCQ